MAGGWLGGHHVSPVAPPLVDAPIPVPDETALDADVQLGDARVTVRRRRARLLRGRVTLGGGIFVLALVPRVMTAGHYVGPDEYAWTMRSSGFSDAIARGDWDHATALLFGRTGTMPGVTTMWVGSAARTLWSWGARLGLWSDADVQAGFAGSWSGLRMSQTVMGVVTAALVAVLALLVARWAGRAAALVAGALIATEPLLVTHGATLHTDELVGLFGVAGLVASALVVGVPHRTCWADRWWGAVAAGAVCCLSVLTKLSGLTMLPGVAVLGGWALVRRWRVPDAAERRDGLVRLARSGGLWLLGAAATLPSYPALLAAPRTELGRLADAAALAGEGHPQYFLGELTWRPGPLFYVVALPLRLTPWFLVALLGAVVGVWLWRGTRGHAAALAALGLPTFLVISLSSKQMDRYGVPVVVVGALVVGVAASHVGRWVHSRASVGEGRLAALGAASAVALLGHALTIAPWSSAYYNPLLGGGEVALRTILVGRGEGLREAGEIIAERERGHCDEVTIRAVFTVWSFPCGRSFSDETPDYWVLDVANRQRTPRPGLAALAAERPLVAVVSVRGVEHVLLYGPPGEVVDETVQVALS